MVAISFSSSVISRNREVNYEKKFSEITCTYMKKVLLLKSEIKNVKQTKTRKRIVLYKHSKILQKKKEKENDKNFPC